MQLALGVAGAAVGSVFGMPGLGWSIGTGLASFLVKPKGSRNVAPQIDLRVPGTEDGQPIHWIRGAMRVAPIWAWNSDRRAISHTTRSGGGGKGMSAPTQENTTYTYEMDALLLLNINGGIGVSEIYWGGELVWKTDSGASAGTFAASGQTERWTRLTVYDGNPAQLPDPDYEAAIAPLEAPAYRGRMTVFIKGLQLGEGGQVPPLEFVVVVDGTSGTQIQYFGGIGTTSSVGSAEAHVVHVPATNELWFPDVAHNSGGTPGNPCRIAIYNLGTEEVSYINFPAGWETADKDTGRWAWHIPEWDVVFISARDSSALTTLAYKATTREYLGSWHEHTLNTFSTELAGIDVVERTAIVEADGEGAKLYRMTSDFMPGILVNDSFPSASGLGYHVVVDNEHNAWGLETNSLVRFSMLTAVRTAFPINPAIGVALGENELCYDSTRHCLYFWSSAGTGNTNYLMKFDIATEVVSALYTEPSADGSEAWHHFIEYDANADRVIVKNGGTAGPFGVFLIDPDTGARTDVEIPDTGGAHFASMFDFVSGTDGSLVLWAHSAQWDGSSVGIGELRFPTITAACPSIAEVQEAICVRGGLDASQVDVTQLDEIDREVCAFPWTGITASRVPTQTMMGTYFYEPVMSGNVIKFVPRGGSPVATIPYDDLGAHIAGAEESEDRFPLRNVNDPEMPAQNVVKFINLAQNYGAGSVQSDRLLTAIPVTMQEVQLDLGLQPAEAKGVADTILRDRAATLARVTIRVLRSSYPTLEPTDVILVVGPDGSEYRLRIVRMTDAFPLLTLECCLDDPNILSATGITTVDYESQSTVLGPPNTIMRLIDGPILQNTDDYAGIYVQTRGDRSFYPGAAVLSSPDDVTYTGEVVIPEPAIFGFALTALHDYTGPKVIDFRSRVRVNIGSDSTLESSTRAAVLASQEVNAIKIGSEYLQFIDADIVSAGVYDLSNFWRGARGTEWAMTGHNEGERVELLRREGMRRITLQTAQLGVTRYYKGVTLGRLESSATAQALAAVDGGLKPFSPARVIVARDGSNNATITVTRRTRLGVRYTGALGISVPLGEQTEAYSIDFYTDDTFTVIADTQAVVGTNIFEYTAAAQTAAGLTPGDDLYMDVHQLSAVIGRGYPLRRAA